MPIHVEHWREAEDGPLSEAALGRKLGARGYAVSCYVYPPGTVFAEHSHAVDKIDAVLGGRFEIVTAGETVVLEPGDWVEIPRGAAHRARVVGDDPVVSLDAVRR